MLNSRPSSTVAIVPNLKAARGIGELFLLAGRELFQPSFRSILAKSLAATLVLLVSLGAGLAHLLRRSGENWMPDSWMSSFPWMSGILTALAGIGVVLFLWLASIPLLRIAAGFFADEIANAIDKGHYRLAELREQSVYSSTAMSLRFAVRTVVINIALIPLIFMPLVGPIIILVVNGYNAGVEYFTLASARRRSASETRAVIRANRRTVWIAGIIIAALTLVPLLNLFVPAFAIALMVHLERELAERQNRHR